MLGTPPVKLGPLTFRLPAELIYLQSKHITNRIYEDVFDFSILEMLAIVLQTSLTPQ
jgi:hypothetical protein